jgi:hypothetical protein
VDDARAADQADVAEPEPVEPPGRSVRRNEPASRYELVEDGVVIGVADFHVRAGDGAVVLPHTVIEPSRRGQDLGAELVAGVLDDVRSAGGRIVPACWYVGEFLDANPDYRDLVAP